MNDQLATLKPDVGTIGISLRIMDSNGRLLVDLNQQLSLRPQSTNETVELDLDCSSSASNNRASTLTATTLDSNRTPLKLTKPITSNNRRTNNQRGQYRVRFDDSDSSAAQIATAPGCTSASATTMSIATPPEVNKSADSTKSTVDLIDRINGSLNKIASFARETRQQYQQQQQQQRPLAQPACRKQQQYVSTQQQATSSDQFTSISGGSSARDSRSAPAVPICVKKTAWNAEELHYAIDSDTADDDELMIDKTNGNAASETAAVTQATISFRGGYGDSNNFNVPKSTTSTTTGTTAAAAPAAMITGNSLANLICKRYQRDVILHTIGGVLDKLHRQQQQQMRKW